MYCVRLIIIEFIPGVTIYGRSFSSQQARQYIMRAVIDFEVMVYTKNVLDTDLHIKNIILVGGADSTCQRALFFNRFG